MRYLLIFVLLAAALPARAADGWTTLKSSHDVAMTADRLAAAVDKAGGTVFARVDHRANARSVGLSLPPTTLVIFGNPKIGTPIIAADRHAGLELPVRVLIWRENGATMIGYENPAAIKQRYTIEGADAAFDKMAGALKKLTTAAAN